MRSTVFHWAGVLARLQSIATAIGIGPGVELPSPVMRHIVVAMAFLVSTVCVGAWMSQRLVNRTIVANLRSDYLGRINQLIPLTMSGSSTSCAN